MTTVYEHTAGKSRIEAIEQWGGNIDIMMTCGIGTTHEEVMRYLLPINESDKFGAALCRDIIENYRKHADHLKQRDEDSQSTIRDLESEIHDLHIRIRERNTTMNDCVVEHNQHTHQLCARIEYLEAINKGLEGDLSNIRIANTLHKERRDERDGELDDCKKAFFDLLDERTEYQNTLRIERVDHIAEKRAINQIHHDIHRSSNSIIKELDAANRELEKDVSNLRIANSLYRKRWSEHENGSASPESRGMLTRRGKTITITLPFEHESVARNAEKYIVGMED